MTSHGKLDQAALPVPEKQTAIENQYVAPTHPDEEALCHIWSEILDVDKVGIRHNFFDLGGHSLMATRLISRVRRQFGVDLEPRYLFESPTVEELCKVIQSISNHSEIKHRPEIRKSGRVRRAISVSADGDIIGNTTTH